jgi:tRNA A-37 threonylcarbamoyl transferase component Bud32/glutamine cyclotransferase
MTTSEDVHLGTDFLGYRVDAQIGRGGMGAVYRAYDLRLKRNVALKLIAPELSADERFRERFLTETELAASLEHPNVVPIHDAGEVDGQLYLAMRYVEGVDLKALLSEVGTLAPERAIAICSQVADALDAAHKRGLVHRDVKPSNVLLDTEEHAYLADFGLSRRLADLGIPVPYALSLGTPAYVAPEQIEGDDVDAGADVYSLGCLLYECLTGEAPYPRESELAVLWAHLNDPPPSPPGLEAVMAKALAKEVQERYASCAELVEAARGALGLREGVVVGTRRPLVLAAVGALAAAGALAAGLVLTLRGSGSPQPDLAVRDNTLVRIDPEANRIAAVTMVGRRGLPLPGAEGVAVGGDTIWVYNWDEQNVRAIDSRTSAIERTVSVSGLPPPGAANSIAADAGGAWVVSGLGGEGVLTRVQIGLVMAQKFTFDYDPLAVAVGEGAVWVGAKNIHGSAVLRINPHTGAVLAAVPLRGAAINETIAGSGLRDLQSIAVGAGAVWAAQGGTIFRIDPSAARITRSVNFPAGEVAAVTTGGGAIWAVISSSGEPVLARIDPRTLHVTKTIAWPGNRFGNFAGSVTFGDGAVWWNGADSGTVWRLEPRTGRIVSTIDIAPPWVAAGDFEPVGIAAGAGGVWVTVTVPP